MIANWLLMLLLEYLEARMTYARRALLLRVARRTPECQSLLTCTQPTAYGGAGSAYLGLLIYVYTGTLITGAGAGTWFAKAITLDLLGILTIET